MKTKAAYQLWYSFYQVLPKTHRYSLGRRVDVLFAEIIEALATASFLPPAEKLPYVRIGIRKLDALKLYLLILWENHSLDNKKYADLSLLLDEIGRMLGGWNGKLMKDLGQNQNTSTSSRRNSSTDSG